MLTERKKVTADYLKSILDELGADDSGFVDIENSALDVDRRYILECFPKTKTLVSIVCRLNREPVKSINRSVSNLEFHNLSSEIDKICRNFVRQLEDQGIKAVNPAMAFPMELNSFPSRGWIVSHKLVAKEAGLGEIGIHRNLIHPRFGSFILLGTILIEAEIDQISKAIDYNPCVNCKLCVAACPVGAIKSDGYFDFSACYNHNYQEFTGGFANWIEDIADSKSAKDYRNKVSYSETAVKWQSLSYKPNYNSAYCLAVCPAGDNVMADYLSDKEDHLKNVLKPLQDKIEPVYVVKDSDAEKHLLKKFPNKKIRRVKSSVRITTIENFILGIKLSFQRGKSLGLNAIYHFEFTGSEVHKVTVKISYQNLEIIDDHIEKPDLFVKADSESWVKFLNKERSILRCLLTGQIKVRGPIRLLLDFENCFT